MWWPTGKSVEQDVVHSAAEMLSGTASEGYQGGVIPDWALIGSLAHGNLRVLGRLSHPSRTNHPEGWAGTLAYLATEILTMAAPDEESLVRLQREALIPLELDLLAHQVAAPRTPAQLASLVVPALERYRLGRNR